MKYSILIIILLSLYLPLTSAKFGDIDIPTLQGLQKKARIYCPDDQQQYPLLIFQHGDYGGGVFLFMYFNFLESIAQQGFCVVAPYSCAIDDMCQTGQTSYLEILKTLVFLNNTVTGYPIDMSQPITIAGHSTGGRAILMVGALKDTIDTDHPYLQGTSEIGDLTEDMKEVLPSIKCIIGVHPDSMYTPEWNPDISGWKISSTPTFIITGTKDQLEPVNSGWKDMEMITTPTRIFVDINGASHMDPFLSTREAILVAKFAKAFSLEEQNAQEYFFGKNQGPLSIEQDYQIASIGEANTGNNTIGYLACNSDDSVSIPEGYISFCSETNYAF